MQIFQETLQWTQERVSRVTPIFFVWQLDSIDQFINIIVSAHILMVEESRYHKGNVDTREATVGLSPGARSRTERPAPVHRSRSGALAWSGGGPASRSATPSRPFIRPGGQ